MTRRVGDRTGAVCAVAHLGAVFVHLAGMIWMTTGFAGIFRPSGGGRRCHSMVATITATIESASTAATIQRTIPARSLPTKPLAPASYFLPLPSSSFLLTVAFG